MAPPRKIEGFAPATLSEWEKEAGIPGREGLEMTKEIAGVIRRGRGSRPSQPQWGRLSASCSVYLSIVAAQEALVRAPRSQEPFWEAGQKQLELTHTTPT